MPMPLVRQDARGLFIVMNGQRYRSGPLDYTLRPGLRCDGGGLVAGMKVRARMIGSTPIAVLTSADGGEDTHWEVESSKDALAAKQAREAANPDTATANRRLFAPVICPVHPSRSV